MAKKKRELTTRQMPSGAQQYTRGDTAGERLRTNSRAFAAAIPTGPRGATSKINDAMIDEFDRDRAARQNESQTRREDSINRRAAGGKMEAKKMATRPTERPSRAPAASQKPTPRPSTADERAAGERGDRAARRDAGMKAGGKVKKMAMGGKCRGMGAATKGGNYSRG